jgi:hypothetical protein
MYPVDASLRTVKISPVHKLVLRSVRIYSPVRSLWRKKYISIYSYLFKSTYMKKQHSSIGRHKNSWDVIHFPQHPSHHTLGNEQCCLKLLLGVCNIFLYLCVGPYTQLPSYGKDLLVVLLFSYFSSFFPAHFTGFHIGVGGTDTYTAAVLSSPLSPHCIQLGGVFTKKQYTQDLK